jgi:cytoskeletal protein CcmA (bactofilin family)
MGTHATQKERIMNRVEDQPREPQFRTSQNSIRREVVNIGKSVFVKGELTGDEDLTIEGRVEGRIELADHKLVIGPNGRIRAEINAKEVTVIGSVEGNLSVQGLLEITSSGSVKGDIRASRISIADGAYFVGHIEMQRSADNLDKFPMLDAQPTARRPEQPILAEA